MQIAIFLSTVLVCLIALGCAFIAYREARAAESAETRIEKALARVSGLAARVAAVEGSFESLRLQHQKLHGKFHATLREWEAAQEPGMGDPNAITAAQAARGSPEDPFLQIAPPCENYAAAQRDGPLSEAAQCQCAYCLRRRLERDELRKKLPPGSHADRVRAIEAAS